MPSLSTKFSLGNSFPLLLILFYLLHNTQANSIQIIRMQLNPNSINTPLLIPYSQVFSITPQFSYFFEQIELLSQEVSINHTLTSIDESSIQIQFNSLFYRNPPGSVDSSLGGSQRFRLMIMVTDFYDGFQLNQLGNIGLNGSTSIINYKNSYSQQSQYKIIVYGLCFPFLSEVVSSDENTTNLQVTLNPSLITTTISISYIIVTKQHILFSIFCVFDQVYQFSPNFILLLDSENYIKPLDSSLFIGIKGLNNTGSTMTIKKYESFDYYHAPALSKAIKIGYEVLDGTIAQINSAVVVFNNDYGSGCTIDSGTAGYFAYQKIYETVPYACIGCHWTCKTCTASQYLSYTDQYFCTSCDTGRYFQPQQDVQRGKCLCLKGLQVDQQGKCIPCISNCLTFIPQFMKASSSPKFLLVFTYADLLFDIPLQDNLIISIDSVQIEYNLTVLREGAYIIEVNKTELQPCEDACSVNFYFTIPHYVRTNSKYLTEQQKTLEIRNFYIIESMMPENLEEVFFIIGSLIAVSAAAGQSSFLKVLFELEQLIEFHKYLNLDLPVVFKEFIEALSTFKFMDILSILPIDINTYMQDLASSELDLKGSAKIIYYENGVNFYKNVIPILLSFGAILIINFLIFVLLRIIPCDFFQKLAEKIRIRWVITLSDMMESLVLPITLFAFYQTTFMVLTTTMIWINCLAFALSFFLVIFPFFPLMYAGVNNFFKKDPIMREIIQDLFQDCNAAYTMTYIGYIYSFFRKVFFAILLLSSIPGLVQVSGMLLVNIVQLLIIIYFVKQGIFLSKVKILTRTMNILCVMSIEFLIMSYNMNYSDLDGMILMGIACTYFAIISTVMGLLEMVVKIFDIIFQKLRQKPKEEVSPEIQKVKYVRNAQCKIGKSLKKPTNHKQSKQKLYYQDSEQFSEKEQSINLSELVPVQSEDGFTNYQQSVHISSQEIVPRKKLRKRNTSRRYEEEENESPESDPSNISNRNRKSSYESSNKSNQESEPLYKRLRKTKSKNEDVKKERKSQELVKMSNSTSKKDKDSMSEIIQIDFEDNEYD